MMLGVIFENGTWNAPGPIARDRLSVFLEQGPIVLDQPLERLPGEVQPVIAGITLFQPGHDAKRLGIVVEAAEIRHGFFERILSRVAKAGVAKVMGQRQRLGEVFVEPQGPGQRTGDLADLDRMGQAGAIVIPFMGHEDLGLVGKAAEGRGMDDPVPVPLEFTAGR